MYRVSSSSGYLRLGNHNIANARAVCHTFFRAFFHTKCKSNTIIERTAVTDDGSVVACWHPEKPFPYECSKPIPVTVCQQNSVLHIQNVSEVYDVFKSKQEELVREDLMKITHTTKHVWFPKYRMKKYRKQRPPLDREYL